MDQKKDRSALKSKVRADYVQGSDLTVVAAANGVPYATAVSWKTASKKSGDDWDVARRARQIAGAGSQEMFSQILEEVGAQFQHTLELIKQDPNIPAVARGELLTKMVDGLSKAAKLAGLVSPEVNELAIGMRVLKLHSDYVAEHFPELRVDFAKIASGFGVELAQRLGVD